MKKKVVVLMLAVALMISAVAVASAESPHETADVFVIATGDVISPDGAQLVRNESGVSVRIHTSGLTAGDVVTLWGVVFNNPGACADPANCGSTDLANPDVRGSGQWVTGLVVGGNGKATFAGRVKVGDTSTIEIAPATDPEGNPIFFPLEDAESEIHFVMRTHGQKLPGSIYDQMSSLNGGCNPSCTNIQAALFK